MWEINVGVWDSKNEGGKDSGKGLENSAIAPRRVNWTQMVVMEKWRKWVIFGDIFDICIYSTFGSRNNRTC